MSRFAHVCLAALARLAHARHAHARHAHARLAHARLAHARLAHARLAHARLAHARLAHARLAHLRLAALAGLAALVLQGPSAAMPQAYAQRGVAQGPPPSGTARVLGRFVDAAGDAVAGVEVRARVSGPQAQPPLECVTGADGRLLLDVPLGEAGAAPRTLSCRATAPGAARMEWAWFDALDGRVLDLGDVAVLPTETLIGHVTDLEGQLLVEGWTVDATHALDFDAVEGRQPITSRATIDAETGQFRIDDLPAGEVRVDASSAAPIRTARAKVTVRRGEVATVELVCKELDRSRRLTVAFSDSMRAWVGPRHGHVSAVGPDGQRVALHPRDLHGLQWESADVANGSYRVEVSDPAFEAVALEDVRPGTQVERPLRGAGRLELEVVDAETGARLTAPSVTAAYDSNRSALWRSPVTPELSGPLPVVSGLLPGATELAFEAPGYARTRARVEDLGPGETRRVTVRLAPLQPLRGRVVTPDGAPAHAVPVALTEGVWPGFEGASLGMGIGAYVDGRMRSLSLSPAQSVTTTDERGEFEFDVLSHGAWTLVVGADPWERVATTVVHPSPEPLVVTQREATTVHVRARLPEGVSAELVRLAVTCPEASEPGVLEVLALHVTSDLPLAPDGSAPPFRVSGRSVSVLLRRRLASGGLAPLARRELAYADLAGRAEVTVDFDLTRSWPCLVQFAAPWPELQTRRTLPMASVVLVPLTPASERPPTSLAEHVLGASSDPEMQRWAGYAPPGRYQVHVRGGGWSEVLSEPLEVTAEAGPERTLTLPLATADVRVVDASGAPRARQNVVVWTDSALEARPSLRTDAKGVLRLFAPPGEVHLALEPPRTPPDWVLGRMFEAQDLPAIAALAPAATIVLGPPSSAEQVVRL